MKEIQLPHPENIRKIYFVGIKGVGMVGLALIAKEASFQVRGSDVSEEFLTDEVLKKFGIGVDTDFKTSDLEAFVNGKFDDILVICTAAHDGLSNPQCVYAEENGIPVLTHGQAVGYFMQGDLFKKNFKGVSVLGCHGKTTISAFASFALSVSQLDPTYTIGTSEIFPNMFSGHFGSSEYFVAEADEFISDIKKDSTVKFLYQRPEYAIINNIDFDHPDVYKDLNDVVSTFREFCLNNVLENGNLIVNGDDPHISQIILEVVQKRPDINIVTYGKGVANVFSITNFVEKGLGSTFDVQKDGNFFDTFKLSIPGFYNAINSLSVIALLDLLKVDKMKIKNAVKDFRGTKRRQEVVGETKKGMVVIDDYAHHPDEIDKTLSAIKRAYPDHKIVAMFQPHTISRTESLRVEFSKAFKNADMAIFLPIFTSKREGELDYSNLYKYIQDSLEKNGTKAVFIPDARNTKKNSPYFVKEDRLPVIEYIQDTIDSPQSIFVTLGAGDIYKISYDLVNT